MASTMKTVDLNADMGESFGPWVMGHDADLMQVITSANMACGFHGGDPDVMAETLRSAAQAGVGVGAHPGFDDLQGFGRRRMQIPAASLGNMVAYQVAAAAGMARAAGMTLTHVKLHGALGNMCSENEEMAMTCLRAAHSVAPDAPMLVIAQTAQQRAAERLDLPWLGEIFADRAYNADATLVDRALPGAVIHDPDEAAARILEMVQSGTIIAVDGTRLPARIDSICCHGDTPEAVGIARAVRAALEGADIRVAGFATRAQ
jgi:UPF0271 protein